MDSINETLYKYIRGMWYESKCKDNEEIKRIICEELEIHQDMDLKKLKLHVLRRCKRELN